MNNPLVKSLFLIFVLTLPAQSYSADNSMYDQPVRIGPYLKKPVAAILKGMNDHGWVVKSEKPGQIVALLDYRSREMIVDINYNSTEISFVAVSDRKLNCKGSGDQCRIEDAYYKSWRNNLRGSIKDAAGDMTKKAMDAAASGK